MLQHKGYIDIDNIREHSTEISSSNVLGFVPGDIIVVQEKIDGSNASAQYDKETDSVMAFSRKLILDYDRNLSGFWNYIQQLDPKPFKAHPTWRIFGEWSGAKNKIIYDERFKNKWVVFDIYDVTEQKWLPQRVVKEFCNEYGFEYIHVFYEGPFVSWEHCRSFMNSPQYGSVQEGIVVKNTTRLSMMGNSRVPYYLKIVNEAFKETMKVREKVVDPEREKAKDEATQLAKTIVTKNRVEKELYKVRDEGLLPDKLAPTDLGTIARILPKRINDDCLKEERETVMACGKDWGKICNSLTMLYARQVVGV